MLSSYVFVRCSDTADLEKRLAKRMSMDEKAKWMEKVEKAPKKLSDYSDLVDKEILNDDLDLAYKDLKEYCMATYLKAFEGVDIWDLKM